jgi:outer membrane protein OmpA-like peptidoglycan-associated protein
VQFAAGSAAIDPASRQLLDALTSVALHCDGFALQVIGPGQGSAALSRERAQAVSAYFASQGVSTVHLSAEAGQGALRFAVSGGPP